MSSSNPTEARTGDGGPSYDLRDEDFERRGWRQGGDYYGNDPGRYGPDAADAQRPRGFNDRWENSYRGETRASNAIPQHNFRGRGPRSYRRSDERIREEACEWLTDDDRIDATDIEVTVAQCEVTLTGTVESREQRRMAEDLVQRVSGVRDVINSLRVESR